MNTLKGDLEQFRKETAATKANFVEETFDLVDEGSISKLDAILLLEYYELLPIGGTIKEMPKFIRDTFIVGYESSRARNAIFYFSDELDEEGFRKEGKEDNDWAQHPNMTIEEGIDLTYDYVKENRIIGTEIDW